MISPNDSFSTQVGIQFVDYFIVRMRTIKLTDLYEESPKSIYWYSHGWNWRAAIAWPCGMWFLMPGLVQRGVDPKGFWDGWTHLYRLSFFLGSLVAAGVYLTLNYFSPMENTRAVDDEDYFGTFSETPVLEGVSSRDGSSWPASETGVVVGAEKGVPMAVKEV
jgi:nucleobase:cation symporter-1, NCS1 family